MRDLVLVLPDLFLADSDALDRARADGLTRLRFAQATPLRGGWRGMLARGLGRADLMVADPADIVAAALGPPPGAPPDGPRDPWLVAPLHLMAGLKTVHLAADGVLRLPPGEAEAIAAAHDAEFGADGLTLRPAGAAGFLLEGLGAAAGALAIEPDRLAGSALDEALPGGAGGPALRAWMTEAEMWLHALPLNRRREARGEPRVTTLWPWGGGNPLREPLAAVAPGAEAEGARWARVWSDDAWVSALGALAGAVVEPLPPDDGQGAALEPLLGAAERSVCAVVPLSGRGLLAFDRGFIAPAVRALQAGRIGRLTVAANDRAVRVERGDRWRLWRPQRDLLEAVAEGGA